MRNEENVSWIDEHLARDRQARWGYRYARAKLAVEERLLWAYRWLTNAPVWHFPGPGEVPGDPVVILARTGTVLPREDPRTRGFYADPEDEDE